MRSPFFPSVERDAVDLSGSATETSGRENHERKYQNVVSRALKHTGRCLLPGKSFTVMTKVGLNASSEEKLMTG